MKNYKRNKAQTSTGKYWIVPGFCEDITQIIMYFQKHEKFNFYSIDYVFHLEILGWCPVGSVLPHGEKVPL